MRTLIDIAIAGLLVIAGLLLGLALLFAKDGTALLIAPICTAANRAANDWTFDLWITGPLLGSGLMYAIGVIRLWSRAGLGHGVLLRQTAGFATGWFALFVALVSPLHHAGAQLFTAHMIEHELIMAVAAPLLVLARPGAGFLWAFPRRIRRGIGWAVRGNGIQGPWRALTSPSVATLLHGAAIWLWHIPLLFDDAVVNLALHRVQHISFPCNRDPFLVGRHSAQRLRAGLRPRICDHDAHRSARGAPDPRPPRPLRSPDRRRAGLGIDAT